MKLIVGPVGDCKERPAKLVWASKGSVPLWVAYTIGYLGIVGKIKIRKRGDFFLVESLEIPSPGSAKISKVLLCLSEDGDVCIKEFETVDYLGDSSVTMRTLDGITLDIIQATLRPGSMQASIKEFKERFNK